ncbi:MAG: GNAT family N-acetyltransferase [Candidatus Nezhaarchaeota archaeon]|nr:GNAT family N-acetyltransferase [Candidatus Nezhaarchaeota archaeon]
MVSVIKAAEEDLDKYKISPGFVKWICSHDDKGKEELRGLLKSKLKEGMEVWLAVDAEEVIGFTIISDWPVLPGAKAIEAMEVAKPYRGRGIGSMMLSKVIKEHDTLIALMPSPEEGYEKELEKFYERFGFHHLTSDYMIRIPDTPEAGYKLRKWIQQLDRLLEIYQVLLREMKMRHDVIYERTPRIALRREMEREEGA